MKSILRNLGTIPFVFLLVGCGSEVSSPMAKDGPSMPPQDSGAGKNMKGRIPPQTGKTPANK